MPPDFGRLNASVLRAFGDGATSETEKAIYTPRGDQAPFDVSGIFTRYKGEVPDPHGQGAPVSVEVTTLGMLISEFPEGFEPLAGDVLYLRGMTFVVEDHQPDGFGWSVLKLGRDE